MVLNINFTIASTCGIIKYTPNKGIIMLDINQNRRIIKCLEENLKAGKSNVFIVQMLTDFLVNTYRYEYSIAKAKSIKLFSGYMIMANDKHNKGVSNGKLY